MSRDRFSLFEQAHMLHAYLITPSGETGYKWASDMAKAVVCTCEGARPCDVCPNCKKAQRGIHPDIVCISKPLDTSGKEKSEIVVAQMREIIADAYVLPNDAEAKAYIIRDADSMNSSAQNAMLKLLEEPPSYAYFFLLASNPASLLPTIRSRLAQINLPPDDEENISADGGNELTNSFLNALNEGKLALAEFCVSIEKLDKETMRAFIVETQQMLVRIMRSTDNMAYGQIFEISKLFNQLESFVGANVSSGHIAGMIMAKLCRD